MKQVCYILFWFLLDSFIEGYYIIYYHFNPLPEVEGYEAQLAQYYEQMDLYLVSGSFRFWIPWLILLTVEKAFKVKLFDVFDRLLIVLCLFFAIINTGDWFWNMNQRDTKNDWLLFILFTSILAGLKIYFNRKNNHR